MQSSTTFWDGMAKKYSQSAIRDMDGYVATLDRTRGYLRPTDRALELGCGTGGTARELAPSVGHITGTDISSKMIEIALARGGEAGITNANYVVAGADATPGDAPFDVVMAHNLLHLLPDTKRTIDHIGSLVKPGGLFISKTPCLAQPGLSLKLRLIVKAIPILQMFNKAPYVCLLTSKALEAMISDAGFTLIESGFHPASSISCYIVARRN